MHEMIDKYCKQIKAVGSRVTCVPAPTNTDEDYLILTNDEDAFYDLVDVLRYTYGFSVCGGSDYIIPADEEEDNAEYGFQSFRQGDLNYIITNSQSFFDSFMQATSIAKEYNLLYKQERVALFQWVLYDVLSDSILDYLDEHFPETQNQPATVQEVIQAITNITPKEVLVC